MGQINILVLNKSTSLTVNFRIWHLYRYARQIYAQQIHKFINAVL